MNSNQNMLNIRKHFVQQHRQIKDKNITLNFMGLDGLFLQA